MKSEPKYTVETGNFCPLGATVASGGINFALYSRNAEKVDLLLFNKATDSTPAATIPMSSRTRYVWHCFVNGLKEGQLYGYCVKGPFVPEKGFRFNPNRLLVDPYAKAISGKFASNVCHLGYDPNSAYLDLSLNAEKNWAGAPKSVAVSDAFDWQGDSLLHLPMQESIIYELHVKSLSAHKSAKAKLGGTYLGTVEKIPYLKKLGITAVELLPVHHCQEEDFLTNKGLTNFWGYNTLGYFAPDSRYSTNEYPGCQVKEFKEMVRAFHKAGIEVILDVVYNHTCEGNERGPTFCYKGIDNPTYYKLAADRRYYMDFTGCGNSLNFGEPQVVKLVMDSLRYWVEVMHVDGFRFDLASVLGRDEGRFDQLGGFFTAIHQDPILSTVKLIAEPWDIACDSYQVGNFPVDWAEWNGKYRDCLRSFVKGNSGKLPELGFRLTGSSDLYGDDGRTSYHSINFITCHDGFTLNDLVSYAAKHNEANLENNNDGANDNNSWNWGAEGETTDPAVINLRKQVMKNYLTLLLVSQGIPMILGGDEFQWTHNGNNNAYCQDNDMNYFDWNLIQKNQEMVEFVRRLIAFRRKHPHFHKKSYFTGTDANLDNIRDINWYDENLNTPDWANPEKRALAFLIQGVELKDLPTPCTDDIMVLVNAHWDGITFKLPECPKDKPWRQIIDTSLAAGKDCAEDQKGFALKNLENYAVSGRAVVVLKR